MPRDAHEIDIHLIYIHGYFSNSLRSISMKINSTMFVGNFPDLFNGLYNPGFVVDSHDRDQRSIRSNRCFQVVETDDTILLYWKIGDVEALLSQFATGIQNAFVFLISPLRLSVTCGIIE